MTVTPVKMNFWGVLLGLTAIALLIIPVLVIGVLKGIVAIIMGALGFIEGLFTSRVS